VWNQNSKQVVPRTKSEPDEDSKSGTAETSQIIIKTHRIMRITETPINPMSLFWCLVYALALFLILVTGILAGSPDSKKASAKN